ncbi:hypothetical protein FOPG_17358 [Fusarium oxysporum f. sp. conglutinans race 2 54008]|uniref:Uncharacterized protein n=1 Tax=Fusarium oxysporum f. sp. conglutinans race 2 54008 TaxID=1089457 RepID=X0H353_FUSOX|nr:hypothetical protein FOPG_17358 [Fusarium oxysporum f. sp. conglutinans race 2 54008]
MGSSHEGRSYKRSTIPWLVLCEAIRERMKTDIIEDDFPEGPGYNYNTIEWLETMTYGTGWYEQSLTECVLEELGFHTPDMDDDPATKNI